MPLVPISPTLGACLRLAWSQVQQARPERAEDPAPVLALASWTLWAMTIDELRRSDPAYEALRRQDPGQALLGLRHAWNLLKHHGHALQDLLVVRVQAARPIVHQAHYPPRCRLIVAPAWEARWKPFQELPPIVNPRHQHHDQEQAYTAYLEERPVTATVEPMQTFLDGMG